MMGWESGVIEERPDRGDKQVKKVSDIEMGKMYRRHYVGGTNIVIPIRKSNREGWIKTKTIGSEPVTEKDIEIVRIKEESLSDWGVLPYDNDMWNKTNWLEKIEEKEK